MHPVVKITRGHWINYRFIKRTPQFILKIFCAEKLPHTSDVSNKSDASYLNINTEKIAAYTYRKKEEEHTFIESETDNEDMVYVKHGINKNT